MKILVLVILIILSGCATAGESIQHNTGIRGLKIIKNLDSTHAYAELDGIYYIVNRTYTGYWVFSALPKIPEGIK